MLVVPPFRPILRPALGPSLLKANLTADGFAVEVLCLNLQFADRIGAFVFERIVNLVGLAVGDFVFSCVRFDKGRTEIVRFVDEVVLPSTEGQELAAVYSRRRMIGALAGLVEEAGTFCRHAAAQLVSRRPWLVGFSSSLQENLASLAIARGLKQAAPGIRTIVGGANTEGVLGEELFASFPEFDFVAQGECDRSLVELAREHREGRAPAPIAGLLRRDLAGAAPRPPCLEAAELERSPLPDFDDYFQQYRQLRHPEAFAPGLAIETSRGCWWGAKQPCAFCGLSNEKWAFRTKSATRVLDEVRALVDRFAIRDIWVVDLILDNRLFRDLFPALAEAPLARFFWETSGALSKRQIRLLEGAQVRRIQAGIESLSDDSLRLMHKPTTRVRNLETLKWCAESGIVVYWNYLCGLPGEPAETAALEELTRAIPHLEPPSEAHLIRVQRFSRYFQERDTAAFGEVRPAAFYSHLYPVSEASRERLAYHFDTSFTRQFAATAQYRRIKTIVRDWRRGHRRSLLEVISGSRGEWLLDTRPGRRRRLRRLSAIERDVLAGCDAAVTREQLTAALPAGHDGSTVTEVLDQLIRDEVVLALDDRVLGIALRRRPNPSPEWPVADRLSRPPFVAALRVLHRLRVLPGGALGFVLHYLPRLLPFVASRIAEAIWGGFAASARVLLGGRPPLNQPAPEALDSEP